MIAWITESPITTGLIISGIGILGLAGYLIHGFIVFLWAKANQPAFSVEIHENATYIRKRNGQLVKIADYAYTKKDLARFNATALRAQKEAEAEREKAH